MKTASWICWLLAMCVCISEAKNKIRRPSSPPYAPTLILKKSRPISHRISMGNTIHIGAPSRQRIPYKHTNYRIRRPTMYNVLSNNWKNQVPIRAFPLNNHAILPQRSTPHTTKDFYSINKLQEYSSQYKPELTILPPTDRRDIDNDKGPIHTIPAPNLSPADKPYNSPIDSEKSADYNPYSNDLNIMNDYRTTIVQNPMTTTFGLAAINSSLPVQRIATDSSPSQHQYEVTESNDVALNEYHTIQPETTHRHQDLDITRLYSIIINNPHQSNELFENHVVNSNAGSNIQFGQSNMPMQTNLHSSLHVGFPSTASPYTVTQQIPANFYIDHPVSAESPLSAMQLYDLLNNFPHKLAEQYTSDQRHILQQQLGQILQPDVITSFSQPQMHSFNYDEQANQLQQQQILSNHDYASESVTADYNLDSESSSIDTRKQNNVHVNEEFTYSINGIEQSENNIDNEETTYRVNPTYFDKVADSAISTNFYTTLPNREAAEKLAALAAAGHVNSRLIGQLQKQQKTDTPKNPMPLNHKNDDDLANQQQIINDEQTYNQSKSYHKSQDRHKPSFKVHNNEKSLQIMIPDDKNDYVTSDNDQQSKITGDNIDVEYEYEDGEIEDSQSTTLFKTISHNNNNSQTEFGTRLYS
ncbi:uncharacterized protein [Anoplolepis gracilipes]|uniref:uncharacterized protein n=1 Tax=Anoplolepis gracilipes TaxID=354296 RepID=UPI003BA24735